MVIIVTIPMLHQQLVVFFPDFRQESGIRKTMAPFLMPLVKDREVNSQSEEEDRIDWEKEKYTALHWIMLDLEDPVSDL